MSHGFCWLSVFSACYKLRQNAPKLISLQTKNDFFLGKCPAPPPHPTPRRLRRLVHPYLNPKYATDPQYSKDKQSDKPDVSVMSILTMTEMTTTTAADNMSNVTTRRLTHLYTDATRTLMRTQTLYEGQNMIQDSNPEFRTRSGSGYLPNCFQHVLDSFSCRYQY